MNKHEEISAYLALPEKERDYLKGIALYKKYGESIRLKEVVFVSENKAPNTRKMLYYELERMLDGKKKPAKKEKKARKTTAKDKKEKPDTEKKEPERRKIETTQGFLRKEFPKIDFGDLPDELKSLVVDRIHLFHKAKEHQAKRDDATSDDVRHKHNSTVVESMLENQMIWDELKYWEENRQILGKHPKFERSKDLEKLREKTPGELHKMLSNIPTYISKAKKAIEANPENEDLVDRKRKLIKKHQWKEKEIKRILGIK